MTKHPMTNDQIPKEKHSMTNDQTPKETPNDQ